MGFPFTFQAYILPHILNCMCVRLFKFHKYLNFGAVLELPKTAGSAQTHKSISSIWIVWSTLYIYLWHHHKLGNFFVTVKQKTIIYFLQGALMTQADSWGVHLKILFSTFILLLLFPKNVRAYRISTNSFRGNYSVLNF